MTEDSELLRRFAQDRSEAAFTELVQRKAGLVYSAALRQLGGDQLLAQDVCQAVFLDLARKARSLCGRPVITSWLYRSTRYAALKAARSRARRQAREKESTLMNELCHDPAFDAAWKEVRPLIDEALCELSDRDRELVLQRYFENRPYAALAAQTGLRENTARVRTERALEKLRGKLARRGIESSATALSLVLATQAVAAPPAGLPAAVAGHALAHSALAGGAGLTFKWLSLAAMKKVPVGATAILAVLATGLAYHEPVSRHVVTAHLVFTICFGLGLVLAVFSLIGGHLFGGHAEFSHADVHGGPSHDVGTHGQVEAGGVMSDMPGFAPVGPTTIFTFMTAFGGFGMILSSSGSFHRYAGPIAAALAFGVAALVAALFTYAFRRTQASSEGRVAALIGQSATVITPIPLSGMGEIAYVQKGSRYSAPARADLGVSVAAGARVRIVRTADVGFLVTPE